MRVLMLVLVCGLALVLGPAVSLSQNSKGGKSKSKGGGPPGAGEMRLPPGDMSQFKTKGSKGKGGPGMDPRPRHVQSRGWAFGRGPRDSHSRPSRPGMPGRMGEGPRDPSGGPGLLATGRTGRSDWSTDAAAAESWFRRADENGDGILNYEEMDDGLRVDRVRWDVNGDGFIDPTEYIMYYQARMQQWKAERDQDGSSPSGSDRDGERGMVRDSFIRGGNIQTRLLPPENDLGRPVVYGPDNLPRELPSWFRERDRDTDGQVSLSEWKRSGEPLNEFRRHDTNDDGLITVEELLRTLRVREERVFAVADARLAGPSQNRGGPGGFGMMGNRSGAGNMPSAWGGGSGFGSRGTPGMPSFGSRGGGGPGPGKGPGRPGPGKGPGGGKGR